MLLFILSSLILLTGCTTSSTSPKNTSKEFILGRDNEDQRIPIYQIQVPLNWIRHDTLPDESVMDTKKALCEFIILENDQFIRIAIHNFPTDKIEERIPSQAQVQRWQTQFQSIEANLSTTIPQAFNGYSGLLLTAIGVVNEEETMMLGWALQLSPEHYQSLQFHSNNKNKAQYKQMRADVTIKATGPLVIMESYQEEIINFARSFELIEEIPLRP